MNQRGEGVFQSQAQANPMDVGKGTALVGAVDQNPGNSANPVDAGATATASIPVNPVLNLVNPSAHSQELVVNSGYQFITGYDNFTLSSSIVSFGVKVLHGSQTVTTEQLAGHTLGIVFIVAFRLVGAFLNVVDDTLGANDRYQAELDRLTKILARHKELEESWMKLAATAQSEKRSEDAATQGQKPQWSKVNAHQAEQAIEKLARVQSLSEFDQHRLYFTLRSVAKHNNQAAVHQATQSVLEQNTASSRERLKTQLKTTLLSKLKPQPIAGKKLRFVGNIFKSVGNFILANVTGITIVTILASFIAAAIPGLTVSMTAVYVVSIAIGLFFAVLKVLHDNKEVIHAKIGQAYQEEKTQYQQHQIIQNFLRQSEQLGVAAVQKDTPCATAVASVKTAKDTQKDVMKPLVVGVSHTLWQRVLADFPLMVAIGAVTGWWGVITVVGLYTGLLGGAGLVGPAAVIAPAVGAALVGLYYFARSFIDLVHDHTAEQAKIAELNANLKIQQDRALQSPTLQQVTQYSRGELLTQFISWFLSSEGAKSPENTKKFFHCIEKFVGVKKSSAEDDVAFYGYLASKMAGPEEELATSFIAGSFSYLQQLLWKKSAVASVHQADANILNLLERLRDHMDSQKGAVANPNKTRIVTRENFIAKAPTFRQSFRVWVGNAFGMTTPIVIGFAVAVAFIAGPAFTAVGIGSALALCVTCYSSAMLTQHRAKRLQNYQSRLAQIDLRDKTAEFALSAQAAAGGQVEVSLPDNNFKSTQGTQLVDGSQPQLQLVSPSASLSGSPSNSASTSPMVSAGRTSGFFNRSLTQPNEDETQGLVLTL